MPWTRSFLGKCANATADAGCRGPAAAGQGGAAVVGAALLRARCGLEVCLLTNFVCAAPATWTPPARPLRRPRPCNPLSTERTTLVGPYPTAQSAYSAPYAFMGCHLGFVAELCVCGTYGGCFGGAVQHLLPGRVLRHDEPVRGELQHVHPARREGRTAAVGHGSRRTLGPGAVAMGAAFPCLRAVDAPGIAVYQQVTDWQLCHKGLFWSVFTLFSYRLSQGLHHEATTPFSQNDCIRGPAAGLWRRYGCIRLLRRPGRLLPGNAELLPVRAHLRPAWRALSRGD